MGVSRGANGWQLDDKADPQQGIMDMMKKMYDEGDEEMKVCLCVLCRVGLTCPQRTIAKAWTESREKSGK
jgi:calcyclin binding protein